MSWQSDNVVSHLTYAARDAAYTARVRRGLLKDAGDDELIGRLYSIHKELSRIAAEMHTHGIYVHRDWLEFMRTCTAQETEEKAEALRRLVGDDKFPTTPEGMKSLMFSRHKRDGIKCFGLPDPKHKDMWTDDSKTSISVDENSLLLLSATTQLPEELIRILAAWREYQKKKKRGGYLNSALLMQATGPDGRLRAGWNSCGTDTMRFSCLAGHTPIRTHVGILPIESVRVGDYVWTHAGRWQPVTAFLPQGRRRVVSMRLSSGLTITCTPDHKWLSADGRWRSLEEIANESVDRESRERGDGACAVPQPGHPYSGADREETQDSAAVRSSGAEDTHAVERAKSAGRAEVLAIEVGPKESDVRQNWRPASQLEGGLRGREGIPDTSVEGRGAALRPQHRDDGVPRSDLAPAAGCDSPHRWEQEEQRHQQSGADYWRGARGHSLYAGEGQPLCRIEEVTDCGCVEVFDLTVEEDHSFWAGGVFAHNCREPNVQNIEQLLRHFLAPPPGHVIVHADKRQLEIRVMAVVAADMVLQDAIDGGDVYSAEAIDYFGLDPATFDPDNNKRDKASRKSAKIIRLARQYGAGKQTVYMQALRQDPGFTFNAANLLSSKFDKRYYRTVEYWHEEMARVKQLGYSEGRILGGRRYYPRPPELSETVNFPIQRTAAEMMNLELIELDRRLKSEVPSAKIIIQLHDAIDVECPEKDEEKVCQVVTSVMDREWTFCGMTRKFQIELKVARASEGDTWAAM